MKLGRVIVGLAACLATSALAYWAPTHDSINRRVFADGQPWGQGFTRGTQRRVLTASDYLTHVLYVASPQRASLRGVPFRRAEVGLLRGTDKPGDAMVSKRLVDWIPYGGKWEDGFETRDEATRWAGLRAVHHFHDPLTASGEFTGATAFPVFASWPSLNALRPGVSATRWVRNEGPEANHWGYPTIGRQFEEMALATSSASREAALAPHAFPTGRGDPVAVGQARSSAPASVSQRFFAHSPATTAGSPRGPSRPAWRRRPPGGAAPRSSCGRRSRSSRAPPR